MIGASFGQRLYDRGLAIPTSHRVIGWLVVALVTLQLTAFALRPSLVGTAKPCNPDSALSPQTLTWSQLDLGHHPL